MPGDNTSFGVELIAPVAMEKGLRFAIREGGRTIVELMNQVDAYIPTPARDIDKPFLMPVEDVFSISGRGAVVTGRVVS